MATLGGHGFGAKVALATAIDNLDRCTGVINLEGGPLDHRYYESFQELKSYVDIASNMDKSLDVSGATKYLTSNISCPKWASIFTQNLEQKGDNVEFKFNVDALSQDMGKYQPDTACWHQHYGLWPGEALAIFAAHSRWVHLATNTLPFYRVIPRLTGKFPGHITTFADHLESPLNHWLHEAPEGSTRFQLANRMWRWMKFHDGKNVMLADKTEAGWYNIPDRGFDVECNTRQGEFTPEHVHHNYLHSDIYEKSREARGAEGATSNQFLPKGQFADESKW
eukprot:CAMPEP_0170479812 /NCGR_PEP_ID=MMETSP0208-20121228/901_1 /TAXON_ID=197538 /ORGANISM="Strombidium inclinatum, Strain S3" /LENGTH=279 /DNA_ID=CAMNT_0010752271 /DNA_START=356 /DNA_END=1195 /DNA_ORIENTATION=+